MAKIAYYTMTSKTKKFVDKVTEYDKILLADEIPPEKVDEPFILVVPAYATEQEHDEFGVQDVCEEFLEYEDNYKNCAGVFGTGNRNFGKLFAITAVDICENFGLELLHTLEMNGSQYDVDKLREELDNIA